MPAKLRRITVTIPLTASGACSTKAPFYPSFDRPSDLLIDAPIGWPHTGAGMLAGGTGVTPMFQVVNAILRDPRDKTQLSLIFANVTEDDILLRTELDTLAAVHPNFSVHYVLNNPPAGADAGTQGPGFEHGDSN